MKFVLTIALTVFSFSVAIAQHGMMPSKEKKEPFLTKTGGRIKYHLEFTDTVIK